MVLSFNQCLADVGDFYPFRVNLFHKACTADDKMSRPAVLSHPRIPLVLDLISADWLDLISADWLDLISAGWLDLISADWLV